MDVSLEEGIGQNVIIEFVDQNNDGTFRITQDPNPEAPVPKVNKKFYIQGKVVRPAPLRKPTRVVEALVNAGGFEDFANQKKIEILRLTGERLNFDYKEVIRGQNMEQE